MSQLCPVPFHGDTIFCIDYQNQPFTPMRPIVENMGLDWGGQAVKLKANKERWTVEMISTVAQDGVEREMLSMPVRKLPAWLNSINPKKVRPELRPKIELYQAESDDALWNYWMNGRAERTPDSSPLSRRTDPERKALTAIINTWVGMAPIHYAAARAQVNAHFGVASVDAMTVAQVKEAIKYVQGKIDALPAAPSALPAAPSIVPAVEAQLANIRAHVREIMACERRMYFTLRDTLPPLRGVTRPLALCLYESMDAGSVLLDAALKQVENTARLVIEYGRG